MPPEPAAKRTIAFIDSQNLFHAAREAFGYTYPNYDVRAMAERVCAGQEWQLAQTRFPDREGDPRWHDFWLAKLAVMGRQGVHVYSRSLPYRNKTVRLPDGTQHTFFTGEEKGIDVRIALDVIRMAHRQKYDVALVFQPGSTSPRSPTRSGPSARSRRGGSRWRARFLRARRAGTVGASNKTDWIRIERETYDTCLDRRDYGSKKRVRGVRTRPTRRRSL